MFGNYIIQNENRKKEPTAPNRSVNPSKSHKFGFVKIVIIITSLHCPFVLVNNC